MSWMAHRTAHLARRAWRAVLRGFVRYQIHSCESYLEACRADGLIHSLSITEWRAQLQAHRVRLAALQPPLRIRHP